VLESGDLERSLRVVLAQLCEFRTGFRYHQRLQEQQGNSVSLVQGFICLPTSLSLSEFFLFVQSLEMLLLVVDFGYENGIPGILGKSKRRE
jgi:hypothetical protein